MVSKDLEVRDLVWAKMKGFPPWPGKITAPTDKVKPPNLKKPQHFVFFYGTHDFAWILDEAITHHSKELLENAKKLKKRSATLQLAIEEIEEEERRREAGEDSPAEEEAAAPEEAEEEAEKASTPKKKQQTPKKSQTPAKKRRQSNDVEDSTEDAVPKKKAKSISPPKKRLEMPRFEAKMASSLKLPTEDSPSSNGFSDCQRKVSVLPTDIQAASHSARILDRYVYPLPPVPALDIETPSEKLLSKGVTPTEKKIGFLGLGAIGRGMVKNLLNSGHKVTVWNRSEDKCDDFVRCGASRADTPSDVVAECDITFCCVSDAAVAKELVFGNCGVLRGLADCGSVRGSKGYVELSSVDPTSSQEIAEAISDKGGRYLEAPVVGSREQAEEGELLVLCAGDEDLFNECSSCLVAATSSSYWLGCDIGVASKLKIVLSALHGGTVALMAEAVALAEASRVPASSLLDVMALGPFGHSFFLEKGRAMVGNEYVPNTALKHCQRDLNMAVELGNAARQPLSLCSMANELFKRAKLMTYADHDMAAVRLGTKI